MFHDRTDAGRQLAEALKGYEAFKPIILALPRGGIPIGFEVAKALHATLDVLVVRKIGVPWNPEFGVGAIAPGVQIFDQPSLNALDLTPSDLKGIIEEEQLELHRRLQAYRGKADFPNISGKTVILIDDGLATGITIQAAIEAIKKLKPAQLILAVPVGPSDTVDRLSHLVDKLICLEIPSHFFAVGSFYHNFPQVSDKEVIDLLRLSPQRHTQELV
jgi:putative phosphoribosyl transferase